MLQLQPNNLITGGESCLFYFSIMDHKLVEQIMQDEDSRMMLTLSAADLREFAATVADNVGRRYAEHTVSEIRAVMGDKMRYCTRKEAMDLLGIKSCATLPMWAKKGYLVPCRVGGKNLYLREEVLHIKNDREKSASRQNVANAQKEESAISCDTTNCRSEKVVDRGLYLIKSIETNHFNMLYSIVDYQHIAA